MISWGQLIWVSFPIPILCLVLLSVPWRPQKLEKIATKVVSGIFFTEVRIGPVGLQLLWVFFVASVAIFTNSILALQSGGSCPTCRLDGRANNETIWYRKALKFRAERNFWLALFNVVLWLLVWKVHRSKKMILALRDRVRELEDTILTIKEQIPTKSDVTNGELQQPTTTQGPKEDAPMEEPKAEEAKKND